MARGHTTNDYGTAVDRSPKWHRPAIIASRWVHWISSIIVLSIAAYFISKFSSHTTHLVYWVSIASIDALFYLPSLFLPATSAYKAYPALLAWVFSYLWLTAFIFASQDYNFGGGYSSPSGVGKHSLKKTLEAFAFLAFFTNLVAQVLEGKLWDIQRFKNQGVHHEKNHGSDITTATAPSGQTAPVATV